MPLTIDRIEAERTAIIVVDMENDFVAPGAPLETPMGHALIPTLQKLLDHARQSGMRVIYTTHTHRRDGCDMGLYGEIWPPIAERATKDLRFAGLRFVVTGRLDSLSRQEAQGKIKELGGAVSSSVSGRTNFVVVGADPGSKYDSAVRLNVPVLDEGQFLKFLEGEEPEVTAKMPEQSEGRSVDREES